MAFKQKLKSFLNEIRESASAKSPTEEELAPSQLAVTPSVAKFKEHLKEYNDPHADQELIDSIDKPYFNEEFDPSQHELENMGEGVSQNDINRDRDKLSQQLQAVSRKVSELVLENHPAYAVELTRVMDLQQSLQSANGICASSRGQLHHARQRFTTSSLGLLANYRKRQQLVALLKSLRTIKTLQRTDIRLREMLEEEDYPGAIQLCLECQKAAATFKHYQCISELSSKLQDTLVMIEEALDVALSKTCGNFDKFHYQKVQTAYRLLGKTQTAMDQLHMHFTSAIHNTAFTIVLGYVELASGRGDTSFQKTHYLDLCKAITPEMFTPCLTDLCKALWEVMKSYYKTMQWHEQHEGEALSVEDDSATSLNRKYIKHKLEHGLARIWGDVQQKVKVYVLSTDLSYFKYEEFIQVLDIVNRLIQVGEEFCGSKSEGLQDSLRKQSINYFRNYHRSRMDELRIFLENEGWELCPVKASFTILMLQEFKFMRSKTEGHGYRVTGLPSAVSDTSISSQGVDFFEKYLDLGSPFDVQNDDEEVEDVLDVSGYADEGHIQPAFTPDSDSDDDVSDELKQEFVDERTGEAPIKRPSSYRRRKSDKSSGKIPPIVTNTTLNVCRLFGRYMQMMKVLKPIAFDVTICLSQLFDYYLYSIFSFFGSELETAEDYERCLSSKLRTTLKRIRDNLIVESEGSPQQVSIAGVMAAPLVDESRRDKVDHPHLSHMVNLSDENNLYGMPARVVATESLVFLAEQFEFLQRHLEGMIPPAKKAFLQQFYSQTVSTAQELRQPVYMTVALRAIHLEQQVHHMAQVKWDIKDIMSLHSGYVDILLKEFEGLKARLARIERLVPIPKAVEHVIWEHCIRLANQSFVEGYAGAKKCSNEGRALMQLDFQQFLTKLEKLTDLRPIPGREFVEGYVKAYYFPEAQLESWIREHKEYSPKQLISLINCLSHINKKSRQRLVNFIEELEKNRR